MKTIQVLDTATINKIAAGEVVERPASVVKELVENSIDAGASFVTIEIIDGGISKIRVTDNGSGIQKKQVKIAFLNHATSKIEKVDDIFNINSLGFRGEALASIASVSQLEIITKPSSEITGKRLEIHGGEIKADEDVGCPNGTTLVVKNLFFNTPARQKFLKKPTTEAGYISEIISKIALGHPEISFKFINNNKTVLSTSGNKNLKNVILNVYGKELIPKLLDLEFIKYNFKISGLIAKPELNRANRTYENLFINGRYIKSDLVRNAIEDAYKTRLTSNKFPVYVINLELPPYEYDVNVHPTKLEVRFDREDEIYNLVYNGVLETLQSQNLIPEVSLSKPIKNNDKILDTPSIYISMELPKIETEVKQKQSKEINNNHKDTIIKSNSKDEVKSQFIKPKSEGAVINNNKEQVLIDYRIIGQAFNTYWFVEQNQSVYVIDQHAAHERILYEKFVNGYKNNKFDSQILLQPLTVKLTLKEKQILLDNLKLFKDIGFELEEFGDSTYIIRAVPVIFNKPENVEFFKEMLDLLDNNSPNISLEVKFNKIASISCRSAVKANNKLSTQEVNALIKDLLGLENPFNCPHGRPTIIELSRNEIEKKFKRIQ